MKTKTQTDDREKKKEEALETNRTALAAKKKKKKKDCTYFTKGEYGNVLQGVWSLKIPKLCAKENEAKSLVA